MSLFAQQAKSEGHEDATAEKGPWLLTLVGHSLFEQLFVNLLKACMSQGLTYHRHHISARLPLASLPEDLRT